MNKEVHPYYVCNFSGGKDSTAMLLKLIEEDYPIDEILFVDTTKEFPEILDNVDMVAQMIKPLKITRLTLEFDYFLSDVILTRGKNKGKAGYGWPDFTQRWCTTHKVRCIDDHLGDRRHTAYRYVGLGADEQKRVDRGRAKYPKLLYPLYDWGMTEQDCLDYCYDRGLDWGGLYEKFSRVSCFCCPLQRIGELKTLYIDFPELWDEMRRMDKSQSRRFTYRYSLQELEDRFDREEVS
jgi:3'-phosphoadenosine 5'-phosphosulfate sulfotransferase (PAPS reductase)/FAD synthetase